MILTIFYDRYCPLCSAEINQLKANKLLHGQLSNGDMIYGLDVTCMAWAAVGKHRWLAILRWPGIRWLSDRAYLFFARYRNTISSLLMSGKKDTNGQKNCNSCKNYY